jgi:hypothetical protein
MNNRDKLISIISDNGLERRVIAELVKVKLEIVDRWLASHESKHHEEVPDMAIELLELKMALRKKKAKRK